MDQPTRFLLQNRAWADEMQLRDAQFFSRMTQGQQPGVFWIGCADSRVPAESITHAAPGELFVHRSIANMVIADDVSLMSALQYAIQALKVNDVVVCGHDQCGGIRAALMPPEMLAAPGGDEGDGDRNYLAERIRPLREFYHRHRGEVDAAGGETARSMQAASEESVARRVDRLVTLNVAAAVQTLAGTPTVRDAWRNGHPLRLHGWVYGLADGRLRKVMSIDEPQISRAEAA